MELPYPQTIVCQIGARRHYAVPVALQQAGLLERLYTDLYAHRNWGTGLVSGLGKAVRIPGIKRWNGRTNDSLPDDKVRSFPLFGWSYKSRAAVARRRNRLTSVWTWGGRRFCQHVCRAGFGSAKAVYCYTSAALEVFEAAKSRGITCILDHATAPRRQEMELVREQSVRYPGWGDAPADDAHVDEYTHRQHQEAQLADVIICGSTFVRNMVDDAWGLGNKCVVVPLGLKVPSTSTPAPKSHSGPLRVLFVGDESLRKGIGDLHTAIQFAGRERFEVRAVGRFDLSAHGRAIASESMQLVGHVPRSEMEQQYRWADVFVLPSVSDTFGLVVPEAMANGVPVVTTTHVGAADIIRSGVDGIIIEPNQPEQLAESLRQLSDDRQLIAKMSANAAHRVRDFSLTEYATRLVQAIRSHKSKSAVAKGVSMTDHAVESLENGAQH